MRLQGKSVLITGGATGIGLQLAKAFLSEGSKVLICGRKLSALEKAKAENQSLQIAQCDVTDQDQVRSLLQTAIGLLGGVDILVNNAAVFRRFNILDNYPLEDQLEEIDINLNGPVRMVNVFLPELLKKEESLIINLTSPSAYVPMASAQIYSATKAAIQSWTKSLRRQLSRTNIKIVELNPPAVDTQMNVNNPDVEGLKLMSAEKFANISIKQLTKNKVEILPSHAGLMKMLNRMAPGFAFKMLNKDR